MSNAELRNKVATTFKKYSSTLTIYRIFNIDGKIFMAVAGPGKDINTDYNSNFYLVNTQNGITMCVPDAPHDPRFKDIFNTLKERLI